MKQISIFCLCFFLAACGEFAGLKTESNSPSSNCFENCSSGDGSQIENKEINLTAKVSGGVHDGASAIAWDKEEQTVTLNLPLTGASYMLSTNNQYSVPGIEGSIISVNQPEASVVQISLQIPLSSILNENGLEGTSTLPNGQSIPSFREGPHGYVDIDLNGTNVRIFLSKGHLGFYIEAPFNPYVPVSYPLINQNDQVLGYLRQIPAIAQSPGAFFVGLVLTPENQQLLVEQL